MNSLIAVLCVAAAATAVVMADPTSEVLVLTTDAWKKTIEAGPALVEFYAPWCGHCKNLAPIYDKLATEVKGRGVTIAKVDCTIEKSLQQENGIRGFPTLKLFKNGGKDVIDYRGGRDVASFVAFLEQHQVLGPAIPVPKPHLRYFQARGRAELIRLALEEQFGGAADAYEDTRFTHEQWFATEKANVDRYTFGQAPQLSIDGLDLVQSGAIIRYLGRKNNWYGGSDNAAQTQVDVVFGGFEDLRSKYSTLVYDKEFASKRVEFVEKTAPVWLTHFERILTKAGGNYFVGNTFSIADLNGFDVLETVYELEPTLFNNYPQLTGFLKRVASRPAIAAYRASGRRPAHASGTSAQWNNENAPATASVSQLLKKHDEL